MFNWLTNLVTRRSINNPAVPLSQAIDYLTAGELTGSGVSVSSTNVLSNPPLWKGVNLISSTIARLPIHLYKKEKSTDARRLADNLPAFGLMKTKPGENYSPFVWKQTTAYHCLIYGNAYSYVFRDDNATPTELLILDPEVTFPVLENGKLFYTTKADGETRKLLPENLLHFKGLSRNGIMGISVIDQLREALGLGIALQKFASVFFGNGARPDLILKIPHKINKDKVEELKRNWNSAHQGLNHSHKIAILTAGTEVDTIARTSQDDNQFLQSREFDLKVVANVLGLDAGWLGSNFNTSYKSLVEINRAFLNHTIEPWLIRFEEELEDKLLTEEQKKRNQWYFEFQRKALERADATTEMDLLIKQLSYAGLSFNEYRTIQNLAPLEGDIGNKHLIPSGFTLLENQAQPPEDPEPETLQLSRSTDIQTSITVTPPEDPEPETLQLSRSTDIQTSINAPDERFTNLLKLDVQRQLSRLQKAIEGARAKEGFAGWIEHKLPTHLDVASESLEPANPEARSIVKGWIERLLNEEKITIEQAMEDLS